MVMSMTLWKEVAHSHDFGMLIGYAGMVVALSMVFFGIKAHRDRNLNGVIGFGAALKVGLAITLIASVMYGLTWEGYLASQENGPQAFLAEYTEQYVAGMRERGASEAEIEQKRQEMAGFQEMYRNPLLRFAITLTEILPVGVLITLLAAALLRRKEVLPA
jgi:hypothetical protein